MKSKLLILTALVFAIQFGCEQPRRGPTVPPEDVAKRQNLPTTQMTLGNKPFTLEIADEEPEREIGLMYRQDMPADHGMIFVFADEAERGFWMSNTYLPLDIIYADHAGKIVSIQKMQPLKLSSVPSNGKAQYAIELNLGVTDQLGLKAGQRLQMPSGLHAKQPQEK